MSPETELMAAEFSTTGDSFERVRVTALFTAPVGSLSLGNDRRYDVARDDERFLMTRPVESDGSSDSVVLVQNFFEELKRLVPR
ncbi:MAG: hypothetical protein EXR95_10980 [Gemmatimonadetes bacterium]|nr:hypothetical protein [Gemmatimonadota bacterium]